MLAALTYTAALLFLYVGIALVAGGLIWGFDPLTTLSGTTIAPWPRMLTGAGTRRTCCRGDRDRRDRPAALDAHPQLRRGGGHADGVDLRPDRRLDLGARRARPVPALDQFNAWQGILREPTDWDPIVRSAWVCALYAVPSIAWALTVFVRRDVAGG